jgi:hypothetical protein
MPVALVLLDRTLRTWRLGPAALAGVAFAGTLSANEMIAAAAMLAALLLVGVHAVVLNSRPPSLGRAAAVIVLVSIPALLLLPIYVPLVTAIYETRGAKPAYGNMSVRDFFPYAYRDFPLFWGSASLLAAVVPSTLVAYRRATTWPLVLAIFVSAAVLLIGVRQTRFGYIVPVAAVLGLATWLDALQRSRLRALKVAGQTLIVALIPLLAYQSLAGLHSFQAQVRFYEVIPGDWVDAMRFLREDTAPDSLVAVGPNEQTFPNGWWVQGLGRRQALIASDPAWLNFPEERARTRQALWIFDRNVTSRESLRRARALGVAYLVVDKRWGRYTAWRRDGMVLQVVVDDADVAIIRV